MEQKISSLQVEVNDKFSQQYNQRINLFQQSDNDSLKESLGSLRKIRKSFKFDDIEVSHNEESKIDEIMEVNHEFIDNKDKNKNEFHQENSNSNIIKENTDSINNDLKFKKLYKSIFCLKCLDKSKSLLEFHKKFLNLLVEFDFFNVNDPTEIEPQIRELITHYFQKIISELNKLNLSQKLSKILGEFKLIDNDLKAENVQENFLDKSLKDKLNKMSGIVKTQQNHLSLSFGGKNENENINIKEVENNNAIDFQISKFLLIFT